MKHRIGINGYFLSRPYTGFGVYTVGLLKAFSKIENKNLKFIVYSPIKTNFEFGQNIELEIVPQKKWLGSSLGKIWWEQISLPLRAKKDRIDLMHTFYPSTPVFQWGVVQMVSIHDATPWHFKAHNIGLKVKMLRKFMIWSSHFAKYFISVSNYARDDVAGIYKIPKEKITVIYNGIDERFRAPVAQLQMQEVARKFNLPKKYIFYIGGFEVHKNVRKMVIAYAKIADKIDYHLVIAGGVFSKARVDVYQDYFDLPKLIDQYKLNNKIHLIGVVPDSDLPALYQGASLYLMLSLAEGFNLPLLQALASKVPAIASNTPASEEIAGDSALLVDGDNIDAIADAIVTLLSDNKKRSELIDKGYEKAKQFRWSDAASQLVDLYEKITKS